MRTIPVPAVSDHDCTLYIAPGSEIYLPTLLDEIEQLEAGGHPVRDRLAISSEATILTDDHIAADAPDQGDMRNRIGSTAKGIGAARADRLWRKAKTVGQLADADVRSRYRDWLGGAWIHWGPAHEMYEGEAVIIEGTQGYGLGLHAGLYPYCTSSDCDAVAFAAMAGLTPGQMQRVRPWVVLRTLPIRVPLCCPFYGRCIRIKRHTFQLRDRPHETPSIETAAV